MQLKLVKKAGTDVLTFVQTQAWLMYVDLDPVKSTFPAVHVHPTWTSYVDVDDQSGQTFSETRKISLRSDMSI